MNKTSIAALALASTLALLASGCDRRDEAAPGERGDNASMGAGDTTTGDQMARSDTEPMTGTPDTTTQGDAGSMGQTMGGAGQAIDDAGITAAVKGKYLVDDTLKGLDISVDTEQGVVRLTGSVQNEAAKEQATRVAQSVDGVVNVDNQLTVQGQGRGRGQQ